MDAELERMYRNRASLKPAERRAVEAAYARALAQHERDYRSAPGKQFRPRQPAADWTPPPEDPATPPPPRKKRDAARNRPATPSPESRVDGAPSGDMAVEPTAKPKFVPRQPADDWTPPPESPSVGSSPTARALVAQGVSPERAAALASEMDANTVRRQAAAADGTTPPSQDESDLSAHQRDAATETGAYRAGRTAQQPGTAGWDAQARNMDRSAGMTEEDVQHSDRQRKYAANARRLQGQGQMNEQQPLDIGTAEEQRQWDDYVRSSPTRLARYAPEEYAAQRAAEDERRYNRVAQRYGEGESQQQRDADARNVVRIPQTPSQRKASEFRDNLETMAMNGDSQARELLAQQYERQRTSNKAFRATAKQAATTRQAEREADPRYRAWRMQMMLAGGRPTAADKARINAIDTLPADQRTAALQYWSAGGRGATPLDVDQAGAMNAMRLLQGANLGSMQNPAMAAAMAAGAGVQAQAQQDAYRKPHEDNLAERYAPSGLFGYDEFTPDEQRLMYDDLVRQGYSSTDAERVVRRIAVERRASAHAPSLGPSAAAPPGGA